MPHGTQYNTGLLIGRAFALSNSELRGRSPNPARELCELAEGDRLAIDMARARFAEFLAGPTPSVEDKRTFELLDAALDYHDRYCAAALAQAAG